MRKFRTQCAMAFRVKVRGLVFVSVLFAPRAPLQKWLPTAPCMCVCVFISDAKSDSFPRTGSFRIVRLIEPVQKAD